MNYLEQLNWRYATKRMNGKSIPQDKLNRILDAIRLSASSFGLQPFEVLVIKDPEMRKKLKPAAFKQPQFDEASEILVFAYYNNLDASHVNDFIENIATTRSVSKESLEEYRKTIQNTVDTKGKEALNVWSSRQAYIALGTGLMAASLEEVDATPMEGFSPDKFDEILGLADKNLRSVVILALGYRDESNDPLAKAKKVRKSKEKFFHFI
ncbi:MAG: NAD(P)H-dependent oxidoreductase [Leptospira sp.]|nr:NAD(P)H-dependent oxidoreductase [Leptospira sp.]NCS92497.1 NAD(P)H-dependent oxidoreductase [Leptospira sp.]